MRYPIVGLGTWSLTEHGKSSGQYEYEVHSVTLHVIVYIWQ